MALELNANFCCNTLYVLHKIGCDVVVKALRY